MEKTGNRKDIGELLGVSESTVHRLIDDDIIVKTARGRYDLPWSVQNYIDYRCNKVKEEYDEEPIELKEKKLYEQMLHEKTKREIAEVKLAKIRGDVHSSQSVELVWTDMLIAFKQKMRALPVRVAAEVNATMNMAEISTLISNRVDEALLELSEYNPEAFYDSDYIDIEDDDYAESPSKNNKTNKTSG